MTQFVVDSDLRTLALALRGLDASAQGGQTPASAGLAAAARVDFAGLAAADWQRLAGLAREQAVAPLLYRSLTAGGWPESVPPGLRSFLHADYRAALAWHTVLYRELQRITAALSAALGPQSVVLLKGPALAELYPHPALRLMNDLDVLVPRDRLEVAVQALAGIGYHEDEPELSPGLSRVPGVHLGLQGGPGGKVRLELHWALVVGSGDRRVPDIEWFWSQIEPWPEGPASRFTPAAQLLYLAAHLILQHGVEGRLLWFYDLHLLVTHCGSQIDWAGLAPRAAGWNWAGALYLALAGLQARFGTPLPPDLLPELAEAAECEARAQAGLRQPKLQTRLAQSWRIYLARLSGPRRLRAIWDALFPRPTYMRWRYHPRPAWLWPLFYPYRWAVIAGDAIVTLYQLLAQRR